MPATRALGRAVPALAAALLIAACSGTPTGSAASSAPAASPSAGGTTGELAITGTDFAFELPASVPAGVTKITMKNAGKEDHQAQLVRIAEGKTMEDLSKALQAPDPSAALALVTLAGGPTAVPPGASGSATVKLEPGAYAFLCFFAGADGVPHIAKGMIAPLEVTGPAAAGDLPAGDATVVTADFAFKGLDKLTPGAHTITIKNDGPQPHEAGIVKLADGVTVPDILKAFTGTAAPSGPPPFTSAGGIGGIASGTTATFDVDLPAGEYAFICFVPDVATGKPHAALGMVGALSVGP